MSIEITKQPVSVTALEKASVSFSVEATGDGLTYQWKQSSNGRSWSNSTLASAKKPTLTMSASINRQGYYFRCVITDSSGNTVTSNSARLTVLYISITKQPSSVEVEAGSQAVFTVGASGDGLVYQWQYKAPDMADYANTTQAGYNTNTLTVDATAEMSGYKYRCFITDAVGNQKTSSAATLTVKVVLVITKQPGNIAAAAGNTVIFAVEATGAVGYQWQCGGEDGASWNDLTWVDADKAYMIHKMNLTNIGYVYRCKLTAEDGSLVYTDVISFVDPVIIITGQPASVTALSGSSASIVVEATGDGLVYRWQCMPVNGVWADLTEDGCDAPALEIAAENAFNGNEYRCMITDADGNCIITDTAVLTVLDKVCNWAASGGDRSIMVTWTASVGAKDYLVYRSLTQEGGYSLVGEADMTEYMDSGLQVGAVYYYKIRSRAADGTLGEYSGAADAMVYGVEITGQPQDAEAEVRALFTVEAVGDALTYQWQRRDYAGETLQWVDVGRNSDTLTVAAERDADGCGYRCRITDSQGYCGISEIAEMHVADVIWSDAPVVAVSWTGENEISVSWTPAVAADAYRVAELTGGEYTNEKIINDGGRIAVFGGMANGLHGFVVQPCLYVDGVEISGDESGPAEVIVPESYLESPCVMLPDMWYGRKLAVSFMARSDDWDNAKGIAVELIIGNDDDPWLMSSQKVVAGSYGETPENGRWTRICEVYELSSEMFCGSAENIENGMVRFRFCSAGGDVQLNRIKAEWGTVATDWSPAPEDAESELGRLSQEVNEAKLLVTPEAIISTVTSTSQWQEQSSRIDQNAEKISLSVTREQLDSMQVGGRNYLKNSDDAVSSTAYCVAKYSFGSETPKAGDICTVRIWGDTGSGASTMFSVSAVVSAGTNYTFGYAEKRDDGTYVYTGAWPVDNAVAVNVYRKPYSDVLVKVDRIKLETGEKATDWTPHWEEFRAGSSIVMTEDKVNITTPEFNVNIAGSDGETNMLSIDEEGAQMTSLSAPNVAMRFDGPDELYVNPSMTPSDKYYRSLSDVFDMLSGKSIDREIRIYLNAGSTEYCSARLRGTTGGGKIHVAAYYNGGSGNAKIVGSLLFDHIGTPVMLQNIDIDAGANSYGVRATGNSTHVTLAMCVLRSTSSTGNSGFMAENGAAGYVGVCEFYNMNYSMIAKNGGVISAMNCSGNCSVRAERGMMFLTGTMPSAASAWNSGAYSELGGKVFYESVDAGYKVTVDKGVSGGSAVTVPATATVTANNVGAYYGSWRSDGTMRQGMYNGSEYAGCMWFSNAAFSGRTIKNAILKLKRLSGSGRSRAVSLYLYTITLASDSGNPHSGRVNYGKLGEIGNGETKSFTIPLAAAQALANGTAKGLMLYAGDGTEMSGKDYSANYCKIGSEGTDLPELTVNY